MKKNIENESSNWYALRVMAGQENKVKSYIEAEFTKKGFSSEDISILIPTEKTFEVKQGKKKLKEKKLFTGYILINMNLGEAAHIMRNVPGALGFMNNRGWSFSKPPVALRQSEIDSILGKVEESEIETAEKAFIVGEKIKIIDGPFKDFIGDIQAVDEDKSKLDIIVKIFERPTPMQLGYAQVEKLS